MSGYEEKGFCVREDKYVLATTLRFSILRIDVCLAGVSGVLLTALSLTLPRRETALSSVSTALGHLALTRTRLSQLHREGPR